MAWGPFLMLATSPQGCGKKGHRERRPGPRHVIWWASLFASVCFLNEWVLAFSLLLKKV